MDKFCTIRRLPAPFAIAVCAACPVPAPDFFIFAGGFDFPYGLFRRTGGLSGGADVILSEIIPACAKRIIGADGLSAGSETRVG